MCCRALGLCYNAVLHSVCRVCESATLEFRSRKLATSMGDENVQATTGEIIAEVERRRAPATEQRAGERTSRLVALVNRLVYWLSKHWMFIFNAAAFAYVGLPVVSPVLMRLGAVWPALVINAVYRPLCHQLPQRSWFLFGPQLAYSLPELAEWMRWDEFPSLSALRDFVGNEDLGFKISLCQRDVAIYGMILLAGLVYGLLRRRQSRVRPLKWWVYMLVGVLPMAVEGGYQWLTYVASSFLPNLSIAPHETTPLLRTATGALFGWATVWLAYPYVEETMSEFRETLHKQYGWE